MFVLYVVALEVVMALLDELKALRGQLRSADVQSDDLFRRLARESIEGAKVDVHDFSEKVGVSRPTVTRWKNGDSVPHPALRRTIYPLLRKEVERAIDLLESAASDPPAVNSGGGSYYAGESLAAKERG
jgi:hypothetical protein